MKPQKVIKEINSIVAQIEGIIKPLQDAAIKLRSTEGKVEGDTAGVETLAAVKEARILIQQARKSSGK